MLRVRLTVIVLLLFTLAAGALPALAQDNAIALDEAGFGLVKNDSLAAQSEAAYTIDLKAGDRVAMDLQGENDNLQVAQFAASYGALDLQSAAPFNYMAWAPGEVKLEFAQSRPWETDAEPSATCSVTVKVVEPGS